MKIRTLPFSIALLFFVQSLYGQNPAPETRNQVFVLLNHHLEKRGSDKYNYANPDFYLGISATSGVFLFFDPKAYMAKAGIRVGYRF